MFTSIRVALPLLVFFAFVGSQIASSAVEPAVASGPGLSAPRFDDSLPAQSQLPKATDDVLVTVNDTPIGQADVDFALRGGHGDELSVPHRNNMLEHIIQQELARQKAVELGLDANPDYREKLRRIEAQLNAFKRRELSELFTRQRITRRAEVSEAEAKQYFAEGDTRIRTELHVWQIMGRKEGRVEQALSAIQQGESFEKVARRQFPNLPKTAGEPWDLGYLKWTQIPKPWQSVINDLKNGEVSGVIRGPNRGFWIIKLIDKRENSQVTFESVKPIISGHLKSLKIEELQEATNRDLRASANVVYAKNASGAEDTVRVPSARLQSETPSE